MCVFACVCVCEYVRTVYIIECVFVVEEGGVSTEAGKPQFVLLCRFVCL